MEKENQLSNFFNGYNRARSSSPEDKTAEDFYEKHVNQVLIDGTRKRIIKAMTEYGTLRWNKAIEEAVKKVETGLLDFDEIISELNKLKK